MPSPEEIVVALERLSRRRVLIGIPQENDPRPGEPIGNAALGYIHEFGGVHIPARPHLIPGVEEAMDDITRRLRAAAETVLSSGQLGQVDAYLGQAGQIAVDSVKNKIRSNIPPPLAPATVRGRTTGHGRRRREARTRGITLKALAQEEIAQGAGGAIALIDTASYINSIVWTLDTT